MNDVKELCDLALQASAPPMRPAEEALAQARRTTRRRDGIASGAAGLAVIALAGVVAVPVINGAGLSQSTQERAAAPAAVTTAPAVPPRVPTSQQAQANGAQVTRLLTEAVPDGYGAKPEFDFTNGETTGVWLQSTNMTLFGAINGVIVSKGARKGLLESYLTRDDAAAPTGDLCSAAVAKRIDPILGALGQCRVITVNGVPIRVTTGTRPDVGQVVLAVRFLDGGVLGVQAMQGQWTYERDSTLPPDARSRPKPQSSAPKLTTLPFTPEDVATLAANPAMLG